MGWDGWDWDTVSSVIEEYLKAPLEEFKCLSVLIINIFEKEIFFWNRNSFFLFQCFRYWEQFEETSKANNKIVKALLKVVRRHLTPPPSSTNVEKLFSCGGLVATDHRSSLSGEKLGPDSLFARKRTDGKLWSWLAIKNIHLYLNYKDNQCVIKK